MLQKTWPRLLNTTSGGLGGRRASGPSSHPEARAAELDKAWAAGLQVAPSGRQELTIVAKLGHVTRQKGPGPSLQPRAPPAATSAGGGPVPGTAGVWGPLLQPPLQAPRAPGPWESVLLPGAPRASLSCPPPPKSRSPAGLTRTSVCRPSSQSHPSRSGPSRTAARIPRLPSGAAAPPRPALTPRPSADRTGDGAPTGPSEVTEVARLGPDLMGRVTL